MERDLNERLSALQEYVPECTKTLWDILREATIIGPYSLRWRGDTCEKIHCLAVVLNVRYEELEDWVRDIVGDHMTEFAVASQGDLSISREQWVLDFLYPYPLTTR